MPHELTYASATFTIASGSVSGSAFALPGWELMNLYVPTIDSGTLQIFGCIDGVPTVFAAIKDGLGNVVLNYAAGTGNFIIDAREMAALAACTHIMAVAGTSQTALRTFTLRARGT